MSLESQVRANLDIANQLLSRCSQLPRSVEGVGVLSKRIKTERDFLIEILSDLSNIKESQVQCSNLRYFSAVLNYIDSLAPSQRPPAASTLNHDQSDRSHKSSDELTTVFNSEKSTTEGYRSDQPVIATPDSRLVLTSREDSQSSPQFSKMSQSTAISISNAHQIPETSKSPTAHSSAKDTVLCGKAEDIVAVLKPYHWSNGCLKVDVVLDHGFTWVKVVARNPGGLYKVWIGACNPGEKSIIDQAEAFLSAAAENCGPKVVFHFANGVVDPIAAELRKMGIVVTGRIVPVPSELDGYAPSDVSSDDGEDVEYPTSTIILSDSPDTRSINLDVTALFALTSNLTNGSAGYRFEEPLLDQQAERERASPALPFVLKVIEGRHLIVCQTSVDAFKSIMAIVGGPEEQRRAREWLPNVHVVPDALTERARNLVLSGRVKERSRVIFGSGDHYNAITLSANEGFAKASFNQGVTFAVILHESRALSEQKQAHAAKIG